MSRRVGFLSPGWLALHLTALALVVTMVLLGRWQLDVSNSKHFSLQNFGYALQWWAFSAFVIGMWVRIVRDARRRSVSSGPTDPTEQSGSQDAEPAASPEPQVAYRRYVMPESATSPAIATDSEHAAYNDYLAQLDADQAAKSRAEGTAP